MRALGKERTLTDRKERLIAEMMREDALSAVPLKRCEVYYVAAGQQLSWGWRAEGRSCSELFGYYYNCVEDARRHGYHVELANKPSPRGA